jgi:hypothetical protein
LVAVVDSRRRGPQWALVAGTGPALACLRARRLAGTAAAAVDAPRSENVWDVGLLQSIQNPRYLVSMLADAPRSESGALVASAAVVDNCPARDNVPELSPSRRRGAEFEAAERREHRLRRRGLRHEGTGAETSVHRESSAPEGRPADATCSACP